MSTIAELLQQHLAARGMSARTFAERSGISYPTVLGLINKNTVPRKTEHRELLRTELGLDQNAWATVLAASGRDAIDIPDEGPLTLQQMVVKALFSKGFTEQSFATHSAIPYPTMMGITRKGAVPRGDTLVRLSECLGLSLAQLQDAVGVSKAQRRADALENDDGSPAPVSAAPSLAQLSAEAVARSGTSVASFARAHGIPYMGMMRLISTGVAPEDATVLDPLRRALGLGNAEFDASVASMGEAPVVIPKHQDSAATPLQAALQAMVQERNLTTKGFAESVDLSPLTAARLLKHGDLPGRSTTHEKLRMFLGMSVEHYRGLVERSRPNHGTGAIVAGDRTVPASSTWHKSPARAVPQVEHGLDDEHVPSQDFTELANAMAGDPTLGELVNALVRMDPGKRKTVSAFLAGLG